MVQTKKCEEGSGEAQDACGKTAGRESEEKKDGTEGSAKDGFLYGSIPGRSIKTKGTPRHISGQHRGGRQGEKKRRSLSPKPENILKKIVGKARDIHLRVTNDGQSNRKKREEKPFQECRGKARGELIISSRPEWWDMWAG